MKKFKNSRLSTDSRKLQTLALKHPNLHKMKMVTVWFSLAVFSQVIFFTGILRRQPGEIQPKLPWRPELTGFPSDCCQRLAFEGC